MYATVTAALADGRFSLSVTLDHARVLSTQHAMATLTIVNRSGAPVYFDETSTIFYVRTGSEWTEQRLHSAAESIAFPPHDVQPGARYAKAIELPSCRVYSDPCTEQIVMQYRVGEAGAYQVYRTPVLRYELVPDPTATYNAYGLNGNRPAFLTYGVAQDTIFPDTLLVKATIPAAEVHAASFGGPTMEDALVAAFRKLGIDASPDEFGQNENSSTWFVQIRINKAAEQRDAIRTAIARVRAELGARITSVSQFLTYDLFRSPPASSLPSLDFAASRDAINRVNELAAIGGAGDIAFAAPARYVLPRVQLGPMSLWPLWNDHSVAVDIFHPLVIDTPQPEPTHALLVEQYLFAGAHAAHIEAMPQVGAFGPDAFYTPYAGWLPSFGPVVEIAADRPELYTVGMASDRAAWHAGLSPEYAAILDAQRRTKVLAQILGVKSEYQSLFALYPPQDTRDYRAIGLATTFSEQEAHGWQRLRRQTLTIARAYADQKMPEAVPISVPDQQTTITVMATASTRQSPDAVRLDADITSEKGAASPIPGSEALAHDVSAQLRRLRHVTGVAARTADWQAGYEIVVSPAEQRTVRAAVETLRRAYEPFRAKIQLHAIPVALHCDDIELRLMKEAVHSDALEAAIVALGTRRPIRKLLLAAVFPLATREDECRSKAEAPGYFSNLTGDIVPALPLKLPLDVTAILVFRTFPERR